MADVRIESRAPTRIDLAGGTLDIWPLYLFIPGAMTINLGIDLFAEATLKTDTGGPNSLTLISTDQSAALTLPWSELEHSEAPPALSLHLKLLRHFARGKTPRGSLQLTTQARSPAGAGLGGSSTLSVAIVGALEQWAHGTFEIGSAGEKLIEIVRDTETTVIQVPAGLQDYYGAMYGGLQELQWQAGHHAHQRFSPELLAEVEKRTLLFYSGQSRNSGINNWALFKDFIDRKGSVRSQFAEISAATHALKHALLKADWKGAGEAIAREWNTRRHLAPGITTPEIDRAFQSASKVGASGKICGAGGGGCFFVFLPSGDPQQKDSLIKEISALGSKALPFKATAHGLEVKSTRA